MAVRTGSRKNRSGSTLVEPFRATEQFLGLRGWGKGASPPQALTLPSPANGGGFREEGLGPLFRREDPAVEGAEGETGQRIWFHPDRDEDGAVLLDPAVASFDLALQPHRGHLLLRLGAAAQKQFGIAPGQSAQHRQIRSGPRRQAQQRRKFRA